MERYVEQLIEDLQAVCNPESMFDLSKSGDCEENLLCNMTRADDREKEEMFMCYAWRKREN